MKSKKLFLLTGIFISILSLSLLHSSCKDDNEGPKPPIDVPEKPDFEKKELMNVNGLIVDENNKPLKDVTVKAGDKTATTNEFGHFVIENVNLVKKHSFVVAEKEGYFRGIRTWIGDKDGDYNVSIKLLPKTVAGEFTAKDGGVITSKQGVKLTFPADAIATADGATYTGKVKVAIQWLDAVSNDFGETMPGDLSAIDSQGETVTLVSHGMAAVELRGETGQLLQIANGKKVNSVVPIADELLSSAKESIPLWYFDETKGMWVEEGAAQRVGDTYVGDLGHFSWWNWDFRDWYVYVSARIIDEDGYPVTNTQFKYMMGLYIGGYPMTDNNGHLSYRVWKYTGGALSMQEKGNVYTCEHLVARYSVEDKDLDLGDIVVENDVFTVIDGDVRVACDQTIPIGGYAYFDIDGKSFFSAVNNNKFRMNAFICLDKNMPVKYAATYTLKYKGKNISINDKAEYVIKTRKYRKENIFLQCINATIKGTVTDCEGKPYTGGYAEFVTSKDERTRCDIVNGSYNIKLDLIKGAQIEGRVFVYNKYLEQKDSEYVLLDFYNNNAIKNFKLEDKIKLSGKIFGCGGTPLANGQVIITSSMFNATIPVINGTYSYTNYNTTCESVNANMTIVDLATGEEVSREVTLKPGDNTIPDITTCGGVIVLLNYFNFEYDGKQTKTMPDNVGGSIYSNYIAISSSLNTGDLQTAIHIDWAYSGVPRTGTFNITSGYVDYMSTGTGVSENHWIVDAKVTVTEVSENPDTGIIILKGTFEGKAGIPEEQESGPMIVVNKKPIKGEFSYTGRNYIPS